MAQYNAKKDIEFLSSHGVTSERDQINWLLANRGVKLNSTSLSELASGARTYDSVPQVSGGDQQQGSSGGSSQQQQQSEDKDGKKSYVTDRLRQDVDKYGAIRQSSTMTLVGNVGAGKGHVDVSRYLSDDMAAFIYDEVTGNLYKTNTWSDVARNEKGWVDSNGRRFKGWVHPESETSWSLKSEGEIKYEARKKGGYGMYAAFGDENTPAAGTEAFNEWALSEYKNSRAMEALSHRYDPSKGKLNVGTDYGQLGTISIRDWVAMGMPGSFGGLTILDSYLEPYKGKTADQVLAMTGGGQGLLVGEDKRKRHSGFAKVVGGALGRHAADKYAKVANISAAVLGMVPTPSTREAAAFLRYTAAEDQSGGSQRAAVKHVAQGATKDVINEAIIAAAAAATYFSAGALAPYTGTLVASVFAGAVTGAVAGVATTAADASVDRVYTGEHDTHQMYNDMGKAAVRGGISGAVSGATGATLNGPVNPASEAYGSVAWYDASRYSGVARVGINATTQGVLAYQQGGKDKWLNVTLAAGGTVVNDARANWNTPRMPSHYAEAASLQERADAGKWGALGSKAYLSPNNSLGGAAPPRDEWGTAWADVAKIRAGEKAPENGSLYIEVGSDGRVTNTNMSIGDILFHRDMGFGGGIKAFVASRGGPKNVSKDQINKRLNDGGWWNTYRNNPEGVSFGEVSRGLGLYAATGYAKLDAGSFFGLLPGAASPTANFWSGNAETGVAGIGPSVLRILDGLTFGLFGFTEPPKEASLDGVKLNVDGREMEAGAIIQGANAPSPPLDQVAVPERPSDVSPVSKVNTGLELEAMSAVPAEVPMAAPVTASEEEEEEEEEDLVKRGRKYYALANVRRPGFLIRGRDMLAGYPSWEEFLADMKAVQ